MSVYKHQGISNGTKHFEWYSEEADPNKSNPYPTGYENLSFLSEVASEQEEAVFIEGAKQGARLYLKSTDWYVIREFDTGIPCPADVKQKRQEAREKL